VAARGGFDTGQQVTVKVMKGCIVLVAYNEQEQRLQDDYKRTKAKLSEIEPLPRFKSASRKALAKSNTNHLA
jgi:toxic protein SymE